MALPASQKGSMLHPKVAMKKHGRKKKRFQHNIVDLPWHSSSFRQTKPSWWIDGRRHTHTHTLDVACFASSRLHVLALKTLTLFLIMLLEIFQLMKIILHEKDHCGRVLQHTEDKIADRKCPSRSRNEQNECCK